MLAIELMVWQIQINNEVKSTKKCTTLNNSCARSNWSLTYKSGLTAWSGTASLYFDEADTAQTALTVGSSITIKVYFEGQASGDKFYEGSAIVTGKSVSASFDGLVESEISFTGTGALSLSTV